jgi:hypothetical protein
LWELCDSARQHVPNRPCTNDRVKHVLCLDKERCDVCQQEYELTVGLVGIARRLGEKRKQERQQEHEKRIIVIPRKNKSRGKEKENGGS